VRLKICHLKQETEPWKEGLRIDIRTKVLYSLRLTTDPMKPSRQIAAVQVCLFGRAILLIVIGFGGYVFYLIYVKDY
jgi:hypothetical protein